MFNRPFTADASTWALANRLSAMEISSDIEVFGPQVVEIMRGADYRFMAIDEHEGYFNGLNGRFSMLRRVRNHPTWSRKLFAAIRDVPQRKDPRRRS